MKIGGLVALILFGTVGIANGQSNQQDSHLMKLLQANFICNQKTQESVLNHNDALDCIEIYNRLKIKLLSDLTFEEYEKLSNSEKRKANREGYLAYLNWIDRNQELAGKLERNAKIILSQNPNF